MKLAILLVVLSAVPSFSAGSRVRLSGGINAENKLRLFVEQNERLKARLLEVAQRESSAGATSLRESDLRDAVSDMSGDNMRLGLGKSQSDRRRALLEKMPGMKPSAMPECQSLVDCNAPHLALDAPDAQRLPDTLRRMVRPWMVLQEARGAEVELRAVDGPGDAALTLRLKDLDAQPLVLNVAPRPLGGFKVWFDRPFVLAALYGHERDMVLRPAR